MRWRVALQLGRVSNLPTVWTNVLAGVVLAGGRAEPWPVALLLVAMSLFYCAGMYFNDAFDRAIDGLERPDRPIPSGQVAAATVFAVGFAMLAAGEALLALLGWRAAASGLALGATIIYYDLHHKTNPLSPIVMGLCRVLVYVTAAVAVAPALTSPVIGGAAVLLAYLIGLTYVAKQETLAAVKNLWPLGFLAAPFVYTAPGALHSPLHAGILAGGLAWVARALSHIVRTDRVDIRRAVVTLIAGISIVDALLIANRGEPTLAAFALGGALLTRLFQRTIPGT